MSERKRVVVLGSTGSIGRQTLEVVRANPEELEVFALVAGTGETALKEQAVEFNVGHLGLGEDAAVEMAALDDAEIVVNAIVGAAGLRASIAALEAGKTLALANKESLVAGGEVCLRAARTGGGRIVPVDSEHAALAQCLEGIDRADVASILITASGGPFRERMDLSNVSQEEALAHPVWKMGKKITIDSATLMNKGLEVIEAHFLFDFDYDRIDVVVHPQSVVHGIVRFHDGVLSMQAATPDMRLPIQWALTGRRNGGLQLPVDLARSRLLEFEPLDHGRFPAVGLACEAGRAGQSYPAVLNAANEVAVQAFLDRLITFDAIVDVVAMTVASHEAFPVEDVAAVVEADTWGRRHARMLMTRAEEGTPSGLGAQVTGTRR